MAFNEQLVEKVAGDPLNFAEDSLDVPDPDNVRAAGLDYHLDNDGILGEEQGCEVILSHHSCLGMQDAGAVVDVQSLLGGDQVRTNDLN